MSIKLTAAQGNLLSIFSQKSFRIPEYQRTYSWNVEKCETLWNDLINQFKDDRNQDYFLGNIVLAKREDVDDKQLDVIDGQQRLITLSILFRLLRDNDKTNKKLTECIYIVDDRTEKIKDYRINSCVNNEAEQNNLKKCLADSEGCVERDMPDEKSRYRQNYDWFKSKIEDTLQNQGFERTREDDTFFAFVDFLLKKVTILPIECESEESALAIFETINDRGLDLSDGDIFKSKLYGLAQREGKQNEFAKWWGDLDKEMNELASKSSERSKDEPMTALFRVYMHVLRGLNEDKSDLVNLRDFFNGKVKNSKKTKEINQDYMLTTPSWEKTMANLEKLKDAWKLLEFGDYPELKSWSKILLKIRDVARNPVLVCIYTQMDYDKDEQACLSDDARQHVHKFMKNLARNLYANAVNKIRDAVAATFYATTFAARNEEYVPTVNLSQGFEDVLQKELTDAKLRYGFSAIIEFSNPNQTYEAIDKLDKLDVEHIVPKRWGNDWYDDWNEKKVDAIMDTVGNLMLFEKALNIKGSNKFFIAKKEKYEKSNLMEPKMLIGVGVTQWTYAEYEKRQQYCVETLMKFFKGDL